jgi:hypothetical protein
MKMEILTVLEVKEFNALHEDTRSGSVMAGV